MRRIRVERGYPAIEAPDMPNREVWEQGYTRRFGTPTYRYFSSYMDRIYSCDELYNKVDQSLIDVNSAETRQWGRTVLEYLGLPIE